MTTTRELLQRERGVTKEAQVFSLERTDNHKPILNESKSDVRSSSFEDARRLHCMHHGCRGFSATRIVHFGQDTTRASEESS